MAKTVLVTGGTLRLGRAIADHLRRVGWRVVTTSHRADAGADVVADFSAPMGPVRAYAATLRLLDGQPPDALVNNAALFTGDDATLNAVNFEAPKKLTMLMAGRETGVGSVVNILDSRILRWGQTPLDQRGSGSSLPVPLWGQTPYEKAKLALLNPLFPRRNQWKTLKITKQPLPFKIFSKKKMSPQMTRGNFSLITIS